MFTRSIKANPEAIDEPQQNFPLVLRLPRLQNNQFVCFALDDRGKEILESKECINEPGSFLITVPELSATEPTTIYVFSDQHIPDQVDKPRPSGRLPMTDEEADIANLLDHLEYEA
jgi:hypothetical protein